MTWNHCIILMMIKLKKKLMLKKDALRKKMNRGMRIEKKNLETMKMKTMIQKLKKVTKVMIENLMNIIQKNTIQRNITQQSITQWSIMITTNHLPNMRIHITTNRHHLDIMNTLSMNTLHMHIIILSHMWIIMPLILPLKNIRNVMKISRLTQTHTKKYHTILEGIRVVTHTMNHLIASNVT